MILLSKFRRDEDGAVSVETAFILTIMVTLTIAAFEVCYGFFQWNAAQQSARVGARLAATSAPVSNQLLTMTGMENGERAGQPMPDYFHSCSGATQSCSAGSYNSMVLSEIVYGPDNDGTCAATSRARRGMCDLFSQVRPENIELSYQSSGLGRTGNPASPAPLITLTLTDLEFEFAVLRYFTPRSIRQMPPVTVTVVAEDMRSGA